MSTLSKKKFQKDEQYFSHYKYFMNEIIEKTHARVSDEHQLMARYGIYLIMGFIIQENPIKSMLYLTAVLSMPVDLSAKSFWLDLT